VRHRRSHPPARPAGQRGGLLAAQRYVPDGSDDKPLATTTLKLRLAVIGYLHHLAGRLPSPTATAVVTETYAGLDLTAREAGDGPRSKLAARIAVLREILASIGDDLPSCAIALLLVGFAGAFRRGELAGIEVDHLEACKHGLRITMPVSKGDRARKGV
jgi:hypothetical protein